MSEILLCLSTALIVGLLMTRLANKINLPAVTAYLVAGLLLGPFFLGALNIPNFGFHTIPDVGSYKILAQLALGFIAFEIGNEFHFAQLKSMGKQAVTVGILQAVAATAAVDAALIALHMMRPDIISLPAAITLGAIAAATAPAATLMVIKQYKADGPLTHLLLMVVAIDDAVGLVLFAVSYGVASALESGRADIITVLVEPMLEIVLSLVIGAIAGYALMIMEKSFHSRSKRTTLSVAAVMFTVGFSMLEFEVGAVKITFSLLLVCMATGTVFCNVCETSHELMERLERWTSPVNFLFFILSGAELDLNILGNASVIFIGIVFIMVRSFGKIAGSYGSCKLVHCNPTICKYLGITLLPQAGVALGMAVTASNLQDGAMIRSIVLFSVLVYELVGPTFTRMSLIAAGEIRPEGRKSSRTKNKPKKTFVLHHHNA